MAFFSQDFLFELQQRSDIVDVISSYVEIKKKGGSRIYTGLCPFHNEKTPSFTVYSESQSYYCFGCGAGGNVISFIERRENLDFIESVKLLAMRAGMEIPNDGTSEQQSSRKRNYEANQLAARFFFSCLNTPDGREARGYLRQRGLSDSTIKKFGMGYAPKGWNDLRDYLRAKGFKDNELIEFGLCGRGKNGSAYDFFRNRVMFPVFDIRGKVVAFSGRRLKDEDSPRKYVNTIDTPVYKKSKVLFAMNFAKNTSNRTIVLAEGQMDAIAMHQAGVDNAVASLGTALTQEQVSEIEKYADRVIIAYDDDEAGHKATQRAIGIFKNTSLTVDVLSIKGAKDADEYIKKFGPESFVSLLEQSKNSLDYQLNTASMNYDLSTDAGKVAYIKEATLIIARSNSAAERDIYSGRIADTLGVSKKPITDQVEYARKQRFVRDKKAEQKDLTDVTKQYSLKAFEKDKLAAVSSEPRILMIIYKNPEIWPKVKDDFNGVIFTDESVGRIFNVLIEEIEDGSFMGESLFAALSSEDGGTLAKIIAMTQVNSESLVSVKDLPLLLKRLRKSNDGMNGDKIKSMDINDIQKLITNGGQNNG